MRKRVFKPGNETAVAVRVETIDIRISFDDFSRIDAQPSETYSPVVASLRLRIAPSTRTVGSSFEVDNGDVRYPRLAFIVLNERSHPFRRLRSAHSPNVGQGQIHPRCNPC